MKIICALNVGKLYENSMSAVNAFQYYEIILLIVKYFIY